MELLPIDETTYDRFQKICELKNGNAPSPSFYNKIMNICIIKRGRTSVQDVGLIQEPGDLKTEAMIALYNYIAETNRRIDELGLYLMERDDFEDTDDEDTKE